MRRRHKPARFKRVERFTPRSTKGIIKTHPLNPTFPLHISQITKQGDLNTAELLVNNKAKVNAYSNSKKTALHLAALYNHHEMIELLLKNKANIEAKTDEICTPLHFAAKKGNLQCVKVLLNHNAKLYQRDFRKWSPLHYAAYNGEETFWVC